MGKTMSIRMDEPNYEFLHKLAKDEHTDLSQSVRDLLNKGRIMLAVERYREGRASLGRAAELAGIPPGDMIEILASYGVKCDLEKDDYRQGLENLMQAW